MIDPPRWSLLSDKLHRYLPGGVDGVAVRIRHPAVCETRRNETESSWLERLEGGRIWGTL